MFSGIREKFVLSPGDKWAQETYAGCPQQQYIPGDRVGIVQVLWVQGPRGQYSGKIRFIEKPGEHDKWGHHVAKRSSDPR